MKKDERILIVGGDKRQKYLHDLLADASINADYVNSGRENEIFCEIEKSKVIVFPVPFSKDKKHIYSDNTEFLIQTEKTLQRLTKDTIVFGGGFSKEDRDFLEEEEIEYHDFLQNEPFLIENAYLTAEGALRLLLENTEESLFNKKVLVTGYGRISEFLCGMLKKLHVQVYTAARNELQLKYAEKRQCIPVNLNNLKSLDDFDFIFNTIPVRLFDDPLLLTMKKGVYIELASSPFGADKNEVTSCGIRFVSGISLPGRFFPVSSAKYIKDYILKYI